MFFLPISHITIFIIIIIIVLFTSTQFQEKIPNEAQKIWEKYVCTTERPRVRKKNILFRWYLKYTYKLCNWLKTQRMCTSSRGVAQNSNESSLVTVCPKKSFENSKNINAQLHEIVFICFKGTYCFRFLRFLDLLLLLFLFFSFLFIFLFVFHLFYQNTIKFNFFGIHIQTHFFYTEVRTIKEILFIILFLGLANRYY